MAHIYGIRKRKLRRILGETGPIGIEANLALNKLRSFTLYRVMGFSLLFRMGVLV